MSGLETTLSGLDGWLSAALDCVAEAVVLSDVRGRIVHVNEAATRLLGRGREEAIGEALDRMFNLGAALGKISDPVRGLAAIEHDFFLELAGKPSKPMICRSRVIEGNAGEIAGVALSLRGVRSGTTNKSEPSLIENRYRLIMEQASDGILISDDRGEFLYVNSRACEMLGYSRDELLTLSIRDVIAPEDIVANPLRYPDVLAGKTLRVERLLRRKDGGIISVDIGATAFEEGRVVAIVRDITERKRAEQALLASEERYRDLFENANDSIFTHDLAGNFTSVNKAGELLSGFSREEAQRMNIADLVVADHLAKAREMITRQLAGESVPAFELDALTKDGRRVTVELKTRLIYHEGKPVGVQGIARDITGRKQADGALRNSERRYRQLFERNLAGVYRSTLDGRLVDCNDSSARILGYDSTDDLLKQRAWNLYFSSDDRNRFVDLLLRHGSLSATELCLRRKDGKPVWVLENATLAAGGPDSEDIIEGTLIDITERKQAEEALRESELRYRTLIERMNEGVTYVDHNDAILYVNQQFSEMTGYSREELTGRVASDLVLTADDKEIVARKNRLRLRGIADQYEVRLRSKGGDAMWVQVSGAPIFDASGTPIGSVGIHTDITARKRAEDALAAEKERLAVTLASIGDGVIATDTAGRIVMMNNVAEKLTGWKLEEVQGQPLVEVLHAVDEKDRERLPNPVEAALEAGQPVVRSRQAILISRVEGERIIADSAAPIRDKDGNTVGVVLVIRDITEKRKMEEELRRAGKLESLGVLAGGIAHDFNNLLTGIVGNISLAKSRARPDDTIYHRLTEAEYACFRAKDLTQQLLTFSKGGAPIMRTASISDLVRESASFAVTGSNTRCVFEISDDLWPVEVDEGQISQVVHNLALNAQQAMPNGGVMLVQARNTSIPPNQSDDAVSLAGRRYVVISVIDRGTGIAEEHLEKIFDPYFTTKPKGSGLGLATCYSIIRNHGGYIDVESKFGSGATFNVFLPASENMLPAVAIPRVALPAGTGRILVMDDEEIIRTVTQDILAQLGYEVSVVRDGAEAVDLYETAVRVGRPFDVVILDLTIPGGVGGKETIAKLREIDPDVRAVVSSGYSNDPIMADFKAYGFSGVAAKPYRVEDLRQILDEVMHKP